MCQALLEDLPNHIERLQECAQAGDIENVELCDRDIKSAAATVGGLALREIAFKIEQAAKMGEVNSLVSDVEVVKAEFDPLNAELDAFCSN